MSAPTMNTTEGALTEPERILRWRLEQMIRLGVPHVLAVDLAASTVDLRLLEQMLGQGCSVDVAARILL